MTVLIPRQTPPPTKNILELNSICVLFILIAMYFSVEIRTMQQDNLGPGSPIKERCVKPVDSFSSRSRYGAQ